MLILDTADFNCYAVKMIIYEDYIPLVQDYECSYNRCKTLTSNVILRSKDMIFLLMMKLSELYDDNPEIAFIMSLYLPFSHLQLIKVLTLCNYMRKIMKYTRYVSVRYNMIKNMMNMLRNIVSLRYSSNKHQRQRYMRTYDVEERTVIYDKANIVENYI